jgi:hypothetical protein
MAVAREACVMVPGVTGTAQRVNQGPVNPDIPASMLRAQNRYPGFESARMRSNSVTVKV